MSGESITILTPTFNRSNQLEILYNSLKQQTFLGFNWLIIDDGSSDKTSDCVKLWQKEQVFEIVYIYKENGGKHTALNSGIPRIDSELTFIVDSDDYLPEHAIEIIMTYHKKYKDDKFEKSLCGYSFLRFYSNGEVNTAFFPENEEIASYLKVRINGGIGGDKAEVFYTDVLKKFPFPVYPDEKFLPEDIVWMQMSEKYNMVHINECVYYCNYLDGGLTKSGRKMKMKSPQAMCLRSKIYLNNSDVCLKAKMKMMLLYMIYGKAAGKNYKTLYSDIQCKALYIAFYIPGIVLYQVWKLMYK